MTMKKQEKNFNSNIQMAVGSNINRTVKIFRTQTNNFTTNMVKCFCNTNYNK